MARKIELQQYSPEEFQCITGDGGNLGSGTYGVVRLASHHVLGQVALKCFSLRPGKVLEEQVKSELACLQKSNNENIVRVYGWTQWADGMAIIMECCSHGNLKDTLLNLNVDLSVPLRLQMCTEMSKGLANVHNFSKEKRMVHTDVKPANVLLAKELHCKLTDFGGARICHYTTAVTSTPNPQRDQYTLAYTAPEVLCQPSLPLRKEQDTYGFGVTTHMLLTRRSPFNTTTEVYVEAVKSGSRPDTAAIEELKKKSNRRDAESVQLMEDLMKECWQQNPGDRPNMLDVTRRLDAQLAKYQPFEIIGDVVKAMKRMGVVVKASHLAERKVSLVKFLPESRSFIGVSEQNDAPRVLAAKDAVSERLEMDSSFKEIFPNTVNEASSMIQQYFDFATKGQYNNSNTVTIQLLRVIESSSNSSADSVEVCAVKLAKKQKYLLALLFFYMAGTLYRNKQNKTYALEGILRCCEGIFHVSDKMMGQDLENKTMLTNLSIPYIRKLAAIVAKLPSVDRKNRCLTWGWCMFYMECTYHSVQDWKSMELILEETVKGLKEVLRGDVETHLIFAHCLNGLGVAQKHQKNYRAACQHYKNAIETYKKLTKESNQSEMAEYVELAQNNLRKAQLKLV